jgi:hypothetical protein
MVTERYPDICNLQRPVCRSGVLGRELTNGMVYIRHPKFSSQIINRESWAFLQMCDGRSLEELNPQIAERLGFQITLDQLRSSVNQFAEQGLFEGTTEVSRNYRLLDASRLVTFLAPLVRWLTSRWFAAITLAALVSCIALLVADWGRLTDEVAHAVRARAVVTLLLYYLTFIPIALLHELGHAIVIRYYGGEVPEIVLRSNAHFAVLTNKSVLKERPQLIWYLSMGTVVDIYIWLTLLIAYHYHSNYLLLMFLLPQTIYFMIYSYSIFNNSDYLKVLAGWLGQPVPTRPWNFIRDSWRKRPETKRASKLVYIMTVSLAVKLVVTAVLIWTFAWKEYRVLILYVVYKALIYAIGHWQQWVSRFIRRRPEEVTKVAVTG